MLTRYDGRMTVTADDPRAPRVQIADALREEIKRGVYVAGTRLPSVRDLAERFDVAAGTVQAALDMLRQESLIFSAGNRGTFVGMADTAEAAEAHLGQRVADLEEQLRALANRVSDLEHSRVPHVANDA